MKYKIDERVGLLHDTGIVIVRAYNQGRYQVEDEHGFSHDYLESQLVPLKGELFPVEDEDVDFKESSEYMDQPHISKKAHRGEQDIWEVDLHIEVLVDSHRDMSNAEIMRKQLSVLQLFLNKVRRNKVRKAVIIHGVGEGVLKSEIRHILANMDDINYHDGDYATYGKGATAVELFYD
jgi:hypothetical protein